MMEYKQMPKYRRTLNNEQLEVLKLLYKFRFASNDLIAEYFGKKNRSFVYKRMNILLEQGLIGKRYDSSYKLLGKPAAYYLTPHGARELMAARENMNVNIKSIYKDKSVSEQFVSSCLEIFGIRNQLKAQYGKKVKFFTRADLSYEDYDYFPRPLPDSYIRLEVQGDSRQFFLDIFRDNELRFVVKRRIKQYIDYAETGEWDDTGTNLPTILLVCESEKLTQYVQRCTPNVLKDISNERTMFMTTARTELINCLAQES